MIIASCEYKLALLLISNTWEYIFKQKMDLEIYFHRR